MKQLLLLLFLPPNAVYGVLLAFLYSKVSAGCPASLQSSHKSDFCCCRVMCELANFGSISARTGEVLRMGRLKWISAVTDRAGRTEIATTTREETEISRRMYEVEY
ncbi:hypothetical protein ASPBRDRAFT_40059 [Aspergillus brasiliensis CBS 101740]|uniref:Secreted protein n=1 Tax=Aspergillus brasiliensis (strain CBS 101740 / IMI 381727 / IBT 21946) TaxID=767769 RepID=A0A1L9UTA7_ASPBC|nr:hypothetical protein ASPBRDRAFT_40059 [Aspergillus brasiliensis CBS 101740]